jgi:dTDP-4-amino-4,6-dideoxygalactose transaminase
VPVDTRANCLDFDPTDLQAKITPNTRAAMIVPLWGYPIDLTETRAILDAAGIALIEDAAHAHGSKIGDRAAGTVGTMGCFSTHDRKLLATGEGGFILTEHKALADAARSYSRLGNLAGQRSGMNFKFNALGAALGMARLPLLDAQIATRTAIAMEIKRGIAGLPFVAELALPHGATPNYYNLVLVLNGLSSDAARQVLEEVNQAGLPVDQVKYGYDLFYNRPVYRHISANCSNAEALVNRVIQLPVHPGIGKTEIDRMVEIIGRIGDAV